MIAAFPEHPSVLQGDVLRLRAASNRPISTRVHFVRFGARVEPHRTDAPQAVRLAPAKPGETASAWNWPILEFHIPESWRPGVYIAMFDDGDDVRRVDARSARALFVVRPRKPQAGILYNLPLFTYHAYNIAHHFDHETETCLYNGARAVTIARPGGGIGGHTWDESIADVYDTGSPRQTFAHWDALAISWLERAGIEMDYCCDLDLHSTPQLLENYRLLLGFGHHEYWTDSMRESLEAHVDRKHNAALFTGNTCWFRIRYDEATKSISRIGRWTDVPEETTFGVSYRYGGGKWRGERPPSEYVVTAPRHWIFEGTDASRGSGFGGEERLLGYECDGTPPKRDGTFEVLAEGSLRHWHVDDGSGELSDTARASMGIAHHGGSLFVAATVDWSRVLAFGEPFVEQITRNVVQRLSR